MAAEDATTGRGGVIIGVVTGLLLVGLIVVVVVSRGSDDTDPVADGGLTATPVSSATEAGTTEAGPVEELTIQGASDIEGDSADLDGDGVEEVVVVGVVGGRTRLQVMRREGDGLLIDFEGEGGSAESIAGLALLDVDGTADTIEIVVTQTSGTEGESTSLWGLQDGAWTPLAARGGCWDGLHTYGIVGVAVEPQRITATCDGSPDPIVSWPSDVYVWDTQVEAFAYESTLQP